MAVHSGNIMNYNRTKSVNLANNNGNTEVNIDVKNLYHRNAYFQKLNYENMEAREFDIPMG